MIKHLVFTSVSAYQLYVLIIAADTVAEAQEKLLSKPGYKYTPVRLFDTEDEVNLFDEQEYDFNGCVVLRHVMYAETEIFLVETYSE